MGFNLKGGQRESVNSLECVIALELTAEEQG